MAQVRTDTYTRSYMHDNSSLSRPNSLFTMHSLPYHIHFSNPLLHSDEDALAGPSRLLSITPLLIFILFLLLSIRLLYLELDDSALQVALEAKCAREIQTTFSSIRLERLRRQCAATSAESTRAQHAKDTAANLLIFKLEQARIHIARLEREKAAAEGGCRDALAHITRLTVRYTRAEEDQAWREARIMELEEQTSTFDARVTALQAECRAMQEDASELDSRLGALQSKNDALKTKAHSLKSRLALVSSHYDGLADRFCVLSEQRDALELKLKAQAQSLSTFGDENSRLRLQDQEMTTLVAELKSQRLKLENKARDQDKLLLDLVAETAAQKDDLSSAAADKEALVTMLTEERFTHHEQAQSLLCTLADKDLVLAQNVELNDLVSQLRANIAGLQGQLSVLQTKSYDRDELLTEVFERKDNLVSVSNEKETLVSVTVEDRLLRPEKVESSLGSTLPTKTADLDALVEKLQSKVKELETLQSEAQNHDELLMEVMAKNVGFSERSEAQRDDLRNLTNEKDALLSVLGAEQLVHASDLANARSALAVAQEEALRLQAALDISFLRESTASTQLDAVTAELEAMKTASSDQQCQFLLQATALRRLEQKKSRLQVEYDDYAEQSERMLMKVTAKLDRYATSKSNLRAEVSEKNEMITALRQRIEHLESTQEDRFWSGPGPADIQVEAVTEPPTSPSPSSELAASHYPSPTSPSPRTLVTDRHRPLLRAGVLIRQALRVCHAPIPKLDIEELAICLPAPVQYRPYALRDDWRMFSPPSKIPAPTQMQMHSDVGLMSPPPSPRLESSSPSKIPVFCATF
ncbi:hypothetical protein BV25DRAFT_475448 [Artomyces pyxidatus]|uniref:Uncharacterized protein n=1 Tax=Artomyces pyxidatus TaxID=48021 RepID=A0ACB8T392_9AGAM|nr:hypothetical protein BV25DRAFT_475448 [Artomyces pyxidatus]